MPNWKKVAVSGSAASFTSLNVDTSITASIVSSSQFIGSLSGTASFATSASYTVTSSIALGVSTSISTQNAQHNVLFVDLSGTGSIQVDAGLRYNPNTNLLTTTASFAISASYAPGSGTSVSASYATTSSYALSASIANIQYVTNSGALALSGIQVTDYDSNVAVTLTNGVLNFVFGTPITPSSLVASLSGFDTNRFNQVTDNYTVNGSWNNGGYTLISASLYEGSTFLTGIVDSGTSLSYNTTTSGSHTYRLAYTASNPSDNSVYTSSITTTGTLSKTNPGNPTISATPTIQLGAASSQIEQGATGSIAFTSASGASNGWVFTYESTNVQSPYTITGSLTGSSSLNITATANYSSSGVSGSDNSPALTTTATSTTTYTKIRSLRSGATLTASYTQTQLENLASWDTTLGGSVGTIQKGTTTATGQTIVINWTGSLYQYIVYDSARPALTAINSSGFNVIGSFTLTTVGSYKVYKTIDLQAGYGGTTATYTLI